MSGVFDGAPSGGTLANHLAAGGAWSPEGGTPEVHHVPPIRPLASEPTARRVRRVRVPELVPTAWTKTEVEQLLATVAGLPRRHRCGLRRSVWWDLAVRVAWDSGLRWGDLVALRVDQIGPDGTVSLTQSKTAKVSTFRLSPTTLEVLRATLAACPRDLVCPWPASGETFRDQFGLIVQKAGIRAGTWKWIRRGSGSDVEQQLPGAGHRHLGNTRAVFDRSYADPKIIGRTTPAPRELLVRALSCEPREKAGGGIHRIRRRIA